ncbi:hypothetical protein BT93_D1459 [Corymbia citriodora subsp. variegata]|nr:hypothetical protein BT93_D1459 [Corymbia citriodora subsp. variegata]
MGSVGNPKAWVPYAYTNTRDCSQGFCSLYCPQWCYIVFPPPPPPLDFSDRNSGPRLSPLVIAVIGIMASAFLLVSYYALISKYCGNTEDRRREDQEPSAQLEDDHNPAVHEPWQIETIGLDEAVIKSITVCKYRKGVGLIEGTCSVCLSEFDEDESIRLLPKCTHAFHIPCIDTWLKSHSSCPLCRSDIVFVSASPVQLPSLVAESYLGDGNRSSVGSQPVNESSADAQNSERLEKEEEIASINPATCKRPFRVFSDLGCWENRHTVIEIGDEGVRRITRSVSMDHSCQPRVTVADVILHPEEESLPVEKFFSDAGSSEPSLGDLSRSGRTRKLLDCLIGPASMKRSFSSGRLLLSGQGNVKSATIPH